MDDIAIVSAGRASYRSPSVEKALRDLAEMAVTEACVSGLCDICLYYGTDLCTVFGQDRGDSHLSSRSRNQKNKSGAIQ
jgi:hypothetical protein